MRYFPEVTPQIALDHAQAADQEASLDSKKASDQSSALYHQHLDTIAGRLGLKAYAFFRHADGDTDLHDGMLASLNIGDAVNGSSAQLARLGFGRGHSVVEMKIANRKRDKMHTFKFRGLQSVVVNIPSSKPRHFETGQLGHISRYEVVSLDEKYFRMEWLLDGGGTIVIEFERVAYSKARFRRLH